MLEISEDTVPFGRIAYLFGAGVDNQRSFYRYLVFGCLAGDRSSTAQVLVGRVRAGTDQSDFEQLRIALFLDAVGYLIERHGGVGRVGAVDVRFKFGQVDFDDAVVVLGGIGHDFLISAQIGGNSLAMSATAARPVAFR